VNLSALEKRVESLKAKLEELRPKEPPPLLVIEFCTELNPLAPEGTKACDHDDGWPKRLVLKPPGYRSEEQS
jgi:hypothetical protein